MKYGLTTKSESRPDQCLVLGGLVLGVFEDKEQPSQYPHLFERLQSQRHEKQDTLYYVSPEGQEVLLMHFGKEKDFTAAFLMKAIKNLVATLNRQKVKNALFCLPRLNNTTPDWQLEKMLLQVDFETYQLLKFKTKETKKIALEAVDFYLEDVSQQALTDAESVARGIRLARDLGNLPANVCTPTYLTSEAQKIADTFETVSVKIHDQAMMKEMGMGSLLAVAQGSDEPAFLIEMQYQGAAKEKPYVLIGKGITFDSGGISIKPASGMEEMKYDMGGAASVFGVMEAVAKLKLPINLVGLVPTAENMPSGKAVKPGDIVSSMSGQTIEIINTDAEGRLILADALTYAERFEPQFVIDIATLTGAMVVALGAVTTGFMTKDNQLAEALSQAAEKSLDKAWRMPLDDEYQEAMSSNLADMVNSGDRTAGSITAACFLSRFAEKFPWAHMDIAGTAWVSGKNGLATGRPVPLLTELLREKCNAR